MKRSVSSEEAVAIYKDVWPAADHDEKEWATISTEIQEFASYKRQANMEAAMVRRGYEFTSEDACKLWWLLHPEEPGMCPHCGGTGKVRR